MVGSEGRRAFEGGEGCGPVAEHGVGPDRQQRSFRPLGRHSLGPLEVRERCPGEPGVEASRRPLLERDGQGVVMTPDRAEPLELEVEHLQAAGNVNPPLTPDLDRAVPGGEMGGVGSGDGEEGLAGRVEPARLQVGPGPVDRPLGAAGENGEGEENSGEGTLRCGTASHDAFVTRAEAVIRDVLHLEPALPTLDGGP